MTALSATVVHASGATPPRVTLSVTGAPNPPASSYASNFTVNTDGWVAGGPAGMVLRDGTHGTGALKITGLTGAYGEKTLTGLSVGVKYKIRMWSHRVTGGGGGSMRLSAHTTGGTELASTGRWVSWSGGWLELEFTATATSHLIRANLADASTPEWWVDTVTVAGSWAGTRLYRTDDNGVDAVVRLSSGHEVSGGTMTVEDWEPALTGNITYRVVDGSGGTATAAAVTFAPTPDVEAVDGLWVTRPDTAASNVGAAGAPTSAHPAWVDADRYRAAREFLGSTHQIIGSAAPASNPGPLSLRRGTMGIHCASYADALKLVELLNPGQPLRLIQPRMAGMDMLFTAADATESPASSTWNRWTVDLTFTEQQGAFV